MTKMPRKMPIFESAEGMASRPAPRTVSHQSAWSRASLVGGGQVLVLTRLITLDIHVAWPWCPLCVLPLPRLPCSQHTVLSLLLSRMCVAPPSAQRTRARSHGIHIIRFRTDGCVSSHACPKTSVYSYGADMRNIRSVAFRYVCDARRRAARGCE